ncbi:nuclear pore complex protein NUP54 [Ipomoea triloba]|uniref:nuclear pore complex protein NUP54 n=1 Tax=Ipomoea triloba TaxID=35885 RepID=UPI00125D50CC|nr:nuclear pore complex protein NUP54 [Ipomoea triloba]GLL49483.1 nuclear pore complex protein NUP54 [Ipomoea trifida]
MFGAQPSSSAFATPSSTPPFGTPSSTPAFGTPSSTPGFGTPSTPAFGTSLFSSPFSQQSQPQQQGSLFQTPQSSSAFSFSTPFGATQSQQNLSASPFGQQPSTQTTSPFANAQLTTQMAPVAPLPFSLADRDIQAIVDAYKEEPGNPKYAFKHLLFSVTEPQQRVKPAGVSDIMWAEAMGKLEGMESSNRERLWPQLIQGFKDLSQRLKLQDEVILSDAERLKLTQSNVKMLQRHFQADTLPWIERMRQKEQGLQRRLLRVMRIIEALEGKGCRLPLMKGEADLAEKLAAITRQLKGSGAEVSRRVQNLLTICRVQDGIGGGSFYLPGSAKIHEQSLVDMQEVLQQQTEAIARLGNVLKRDMRDMEIIMAEETEMIED